MSGIEALFYLCGAILELLFFIGELIAKLIVSVWKKIFRYEEKENIMSENKKSENKKSDNIITIAENNVVLVVAVVVALPIIMILLYKGAMSNGTNQTQRICDREAKIVLSQLQKGVEPNISEKQDYWGNDLEYHYEAKSDALVSTVNSHGLDGIKGTKDDVSSTVKDVNNTKFIGKWIGNKSKELGKGILEGITEDSVFDKDISSEPEPEETPEKNPEPEEETPETEEKEPSFLDSLKNKFYSKEEDE
ncbi:MAG: hypothetical protein ACW99G_12920 [Candidatus Thorarchaeota archaeon]|jgi:hypothetical protein